MKSKTSPRHLELAKDVIALVELISILQANPNAEPQRDDFYELLVKTIKRENGDDRVVAEACCEALLKLKLDGPEAVQWFLGELETESCLQYMVKQGRANPLPCLLFTIPVIFPTFGKPSDYLAVDDMFESMHDILADADVVDAHAGFRLLPRLFTFEDLFARSPHEVRALTLSLGAQVLEDPRGTLSLEPQLSRARKPVTSEIATDFPYATLRYIVGIGATFPQDIHDIFPPLEEETMDEDDVKSLQTGPGNEANEPGGWLEEGTYWSEVFGEAVSICSNSMTPVSHVAAPDGFHGGLHMGLELLRAENARLQLEYAARAVDLTPADLVVTELPLTENGVQVVGVQVELRAHAEDEEPLETLQWRMFPREDLDECFEMLYTFMDTMGMTPEEPLVESGTAFSRCLH